MKMTTERKERPFIIVFDRYEGLTKKAVNMLNAALYDMCTAPVRAKAADSLTDEDRSCGIVAVGLASHPLICAAAEKGFFVPERAAQGYSVAVGENPLWGGDLAVIQGADDAGVLYGAIEFVTRYLGGGVYAGRRPYMEYESFFDKPMCSPLPAFVSRSAPGVSRRGIWTWGHVIYDYRAFFENMARLKMNEVVIWNNHIPLNHADVTEYAHSLGIRLIWGFAWGWDTDFAKLDLADSAVLERIKASALERFESEYACSGCDGIYFQSFTEIDREYLGGRLIADAVVELVNDIGGRILEMDPGLEIQFGLHAQSVRNRLDYIAKVDPRISIVWENCGDFPYVNLRHEAELGDAPMDGGTVEFTRRIMDLRGGTDGFGVVLKGLVSLDWDTFVHPPADLILGERSEKCLAQISERRKPLYKIRQESFMRHSDDIAAVARELTRSSRPVSALLLVEDGAFEAGIPLPVAIVAEALWDGARSGAEIVTAAMRNPFVKLSNL